MHAGDSSMNSSHAEKTAAAMAVSVIRSWWSSYQLDKSHPRDITEEDEDELARRRQLSINLSQTLKTRQLLINFDAGRPTLSLRAPLDLVNFPSVSRPHWPIECEVISDIIQHIEWDPQVPEPFYQATGHERTPMPVEDERGKVIYCIDPATKHPYFTCSRVGGSRGPIKSATPFDLKQTDVTLEFESRFESGNLQKAVQVGVYEYELTLRTDLYTDKHTQWFYFRVRNMKAEATYRFTIINFMKSSSLYSQGMRPLLYSERAAKENGVGWQRIGSNIKYYRNSSQTPKDNNNSDVITLYSLTWTVRFPYDSDTCYLAHCYPYTYSHLQRYLRCISSNPAVASYCKVRVLCHSLAGNAVYVVTITSRVVCRLEGRTKKAVVVTARVHPGETNSSWMMEGFLDFLLGDSDDARLLRDTFIFKVVPMLNPDGVIVGNYRCSLAGRDLNRNYKTLLRDSFPCVWHTRNMVERLMAEADVVLYCDLHGHNRKNNVFMYGCNNRADASPKLHERVFPLMMSKNASNKFSFKSCKFRVQKSKEGTGRIAMWRLGIKNSYTMEATFGGSTLGDRRGTHFTTRDLKSLGFYLCDTLLDYCDPDPTKTSYCLTELGALVRKEARERLGKDLGSDCNISVSDLETSTSGSNSSDSDGLPVHLLRQQQTGLQQQTTAKKKKKRLRSRKERNRLQSDRVKNDSQPKVLLSSIKCIESNLTLDNTVKERPVGKHRRKWQVNGLIRKDTIPPPTTHSGDVSQVTLWQGCEPVQDICLENLNTSSLHHRTKACPHHTGDSVMNSRQWRCPSAQLLHLSALLPPAPKFLQTCQQQHRIPKQSFNIYRGRASSLTASNRCPTSIYMTVVPDIISTKSLMSNLKFDNFSNLRNRKSLCVSERHIGPEDPSSSPIKQQDEEQEDLSGAEFREQDQKTMSSLFMPVLREQKGKGSNTDNLEGKTHMSISTSLSKPSALMKKEPPRPQSDNHSGLQAKDINHCVFGSESQPCVAVHKATVRRPSQSAPS